MMKRLALLALFPLLAFGLILSLCRVLDWVQKGHCDDALR